ncbi:hypothetical protein RB195_018582 [Necator americanus]|uniref:Uncharacterized protein n=1 Tax=Necator americanus TaxID=51031 RepID=A0ABR1CAE6_NECAM
MGGLKDEECRTNFHQRTSIHVGVRTRKKLCYADSFTKYIQEAAKETIPVQMPLKNWRFQPGKASYKKAASAATTPR